VNAWKKQADDSWKVAIDNRTIATADSAYRFRCYNASVPGIVHSRFSTPRMFDAADQIELFTASPQLCFHARDMLCRHHQNHSHAQIKSLQQLVPLDFAQAREITKYRKHRPLMEFDDGLNICGKSARQISGDPAPVMWPWKKPSLARECFSEGASTRGEASEAPRLFCFQHLPRMHLDRAWRLRTQVCEPENTRWYAVRWRAVPAAGRPASRAARRAVFSAPRPRL